MTWRATATDNEGRVTAYELSFSGYPWQAQASSANTSASQTPATSGPSTPSNDRRQLCLNLDSLPMVAKQVRGQ